MAQTKATLKAAGVPQEALDHADRQGFSLDTVGSIWDTLKSLGCDAAPLIRQLLATQNSSWAQLVLLMLNVLCPPVTLPAS